MTDQTLKKQSSAEALELLESLRKVFLVEINADSEKFYCTLWSDKKHPSHYEWISASEAENFDDAILLMKAELK